MPSTMIKNFIICLLLAAFCSLASGCRVTATNEQEKLYEVMKNLNELSSIAEESIHNMTERIRINAKDFVESKMKGIKEMRKLRSGSDPCEFDYLNKVLSDALDKIYCCRKDNLAVFEKMSLYGLREGIKTLVSELDTVCTSPTSTREWVSFAVDDAKRISTEYLRLAARVKDNGIPMGPFKRAVDHCASEALSFLKETVKNDLDAFKTTLKTNDCKSLDESVNWTERPQC